MKKRTVYLAGFLMAVASLNAQNINLPSPEMSGGLPTNEAIARRHSTRNFDPSKQLTIQTVSNLLWAVCGINRPDTELRTNPTARNLQEIDVYYFNCEGVYRYDYKHHQLIEIVRGDYRTLVAGNEKFSQDFVLDAPASIVIVADVSKSGDTASLIDAGIACENINLFCAANGIATVPRMTMDVTGIQNLLDLPNSMLPIMNNPIGYAK